MPCIVQQSAEQSVPFGFIMLAALHGQDIDISCLNLHRMWRALCLEVHPVHGLSHARRHSDIAESGLW